MTKIEGVLLDIDGTLVDSNDAHARAWVQALEQGGHSVSYEQVRAIIGKGADKLLPETIGLEKDSEEGKKLSAAWQQIFTDSYMPTLKATRGAAALIRRLESDGLKLMIATSAEQGLLKSLLQVAGVPDLVDRATTSADAKNSKPDPDIVSAALEKIGLSPEQVIMLGDTPYDIEAAGKAGVKATAVRSGGWTDVDLNGALAVYDDPADLLLHLGETLLAG